MFSKHDSQGSSQPAGTLDLVQPHRGGIAAVAERVGMQTRTLVIATILVAAVSTSALTVRFAGAQAVDQTGPNGGQCHLHKSGGDFVDPSNDDTTNNGNISLSPNTGNPDGLPPGDAPAGCSLTTMLPPVNPPPTPTPVPPTTNGRNINVQHIGNVKAN